MNKIIEIKSLEKSYGKKTVLKNVNLDVYEGERIAIMGSNGCGKTTLMEVIAMFLKPEEGKLKINIQGNVKNEIGIQLQAGEWPSGITPKDMISFYKCIYDKFSDSWEKELLDIFDINDFLDTPLKKLSGGQGQRFNAMISMMNKPKIVILDELTTGLDMELQYKITDFFKKVTIEEKQTLLLVSHHPDEVEMLCDRILILKDGTIFLDKKTKEVVKKYKSVRNLMEQFFKGEISNA